MKYLRFAAQQYIDTGIAPAAGYRIVTNIRMAIDSSIMPAFGSRNTSGSASASSFNLFWLADFSGSAFRYRFRADYGGTGDDTIFEVDSTSIPFDQQLVFAVDFGKTTTINGKSYTSPTDTTGSARNIYVGSINNAGTPDTRAFRGDFSEFIIFDASNNEVFHGMPVQQGSTEFSTTPAPSNCYWDTISGTYKQKAAGTGVIWYEDTDDNLTQPDYAVAQSDDYGLKVLAEGDVDVAYMNSKYPLFGSDISNSDSQFKTYTFTLTGFNSEPSPAYPAYVYDGNFYYGDGVVQRTAQTIDTGFKGGKIKSILIQHNGVDNSQWQARARQYTFFDLDGTNINTLLNPVSKSAPGYIQLTNSVLTMSEGATADIPVFAGQQGTAQWNTLAGFNGGTYYQNFFAVPTAFVNIDADGILRFKTAIVYNWVQRAFTSGGYTYRARFCNWAWYQGVTVTVTVLNTPYEI